MISAAMVTNMAKATRGEMLAALNLEDAEYQAHVRLLTHNREMKQGQVYDQEEIEEDVNL